MIQKFSLKPFHFFDHLNLGSKVNVIFNIVLVKGFASTVILNLGIYFIKSLISFNVSSFIFKSYDTSLGSFVIISLISTYFVLSIFSHNSLFKYPWPECLSYFLFLSIVLLFKLS